MALIKSITCPDTGITAEYWVLRNINYDAERGVSEYSFKGYISEQHFIDGKKPSLFRYGEFPAGDYPQLSGGAVTVCQAKLKLKPEFEGAEDA